MLTNEEMRILQEAYNQSVLDLLKKKRSCGPNCKICQKEKLPIEPR